MRIRKATECERDQELSVFSPILSRLCEACSALGAALVDAEGETVDYAGRVDPFEIRVAAAEWRLVLALVQSIERNPSRAWTRAHEIVVRARSQSFALWALHDGYALVLVLPRHAFRVSRRALAQASEELRAEVGLGSLGPAERLRWTRVDVRCAIDDDKRPDAVWHEGAWQAVTVLGRIEAPHVDPLEIGYLARAASGRELLLVREPLGKWFAGDPI